MKKLKETLNNQDLKKKLKRIEYQCFLLESKEPMGVFFLLVVRRLKHRHQSVTTLFPSLSPGSPREKKNIHWPSLDHVPIVCSSIDSLTKTSTDNREDGP